MKVHYSSELKENQAEGALSSWWKGGPCDPVLARMFTNPFSGFQNNKVLDLARINSTSSA
jgi:hypothetical protein